VKRTLLILTAIVVLAVMLAGCEYLPWNFGKIKVTYEYDKEIFRTVSNPAWAKKGDLVVTAFPLQEKHVGTYGPLDFTIEVKDINKTDVPASVGDVMNGDVFTGFQIEVPDVGQKGITISITLNKG